MSDDRIEGRGVTGNAALLLGTIAGALFDYGYQVIPELIDAANGTQVLRFERTGSTFRVTVEQVGGVE